MTAMGDILKVRLIQTKFVDHKTKSAPKSKETKASQFLTGDAIDKVLNSVYSETSRGSQLRDSQVKLGITYRKTEKSQPFREAFAASGSGRGKLTKTQHDKQCNRPSKHKQMFFDRPEPLSRGKKTLLPPIDPWSLHTPLEILLPIRPISRKENPRSPAEMETVEPPISQKIMTFTAKGLERREGSATAPLISHRSNKAAICSSSDGRPALNPVHTGKTISSAVYQGSLVATELQQIREGSTNGDHPIDWADDLKANQSLEPESDSEIDFLLPALDQSDESDSEPPMPRTNLSSPPMLLQTRLPPSELAHLSPPIPATSNPIEALIEMRIPLNQLTPEWIRRYMPTEEAQWEYCHKMETLFRIPDKEERSARLAELWPHPLPNTPTARRFPNFQPRVKKVGAHPLLVEMVRHGMLLDWKLHE